MTKIKQFKEGSIFLFYSGVNSAALILSALVSALVQYFFMDTSFYGWHWYDAFGMAGVYSILALVLSLLFPPCWIFHLITAVFIYHRSRKFILITAPLYALIGIYIPNWSVISMGV